MDLEAQLWILDPHIAAALDNFPFFWVLVVAFFSCQFVLGVFCVLGPDFGGSRSYFVLRTSLLSAGAGLSNQATLLSRVWGGSCVSRPAYIPRSVPGCGLGHRATQLWHRTAVFSCYYIFRPADPAPLGAGGNLSILATQTVVQDCVTSCFLLFRWHNFVSTPLLGLWRYFAFSLFRRHLHAPAPLSGDMVVVFLYVFPVPYG